MAYPVMENTLFYSNCFDDFPIFWICIENCLRYVNSSVIEWWEYVTPIILCTFCLIKDMEFSHAFLYSSYNVLKRQDDKDYYMKRGLKWKRRHT